MNMSAVAPLTRMPAAATPITVASATGTFLFLQFYRTIPPELVEAARIDGTGPWRFYIDILLPLSKTNFAALGAIGAHKGSNVLHDLALDARLRDLPIQYQVVGYTNMPERLASVGVTETGAYGSDQEAMDLLRTLRIDLVLIASIWPETYCYTLSLARAAGVPPVVFDLGAPAERLRARGEGVIVDPALARDVSAFNDLLLGLPLPELYARRGEYGQFVYRDILRTYYGLAERDAEERARLSA